MKTRLALAAVVVVGAGAWLGLASRAREPAPEAVREAPEAAASPVETSPAGPRSRPAAPLAPRRPGLALAGDPIPEPVAALKTALAGGDDLELVVAVEAAVEANATGALEALALVDLKRAPSSAPAVIQGMATLARDAGPRERKEAASTLARWFREERARDGADAEGNTTTLIDALADTGHREAVDALVAALDEHQLPLHNETLIVQRLAELRQASARAGIARFQARLAALPVAEGIDEELRHEAIAAARDALEKLGG